MEILSSFDSKIIFELITLILAVFGGVKVVFIKVAKAIDEIEDVVTLASNTSEEFADVLNAIVAAVNPEPNGTIKVEPAEWDKIKKEIGEMQEKAGKFPKEIKEAIESIKAVFKKAKK